MSRNEGVDSPNYLPLHFSVAHSPQARQNTLSGRANRMQSAPPLRKLGLSDITGLTRLAFKEGMLDAEGG